jgi:hypothetical protein
MMLDVLPKPSEPWHVTPGADSFGPAIHARRPSPFSIRKALASMGARTMTDLRRLPRVGEEKGDRAELERVMVGSFPLTIGQPTIITREFPVGDPWLTMTLNLRGELLGGGTTPTGTVLADAPMPLWQIALTTDLDKDVIEPSVSARPLYRFAQIMEGTAGEIVAPTVPGIAATTTFNVVLTIIFADPRLLVPEDSLLDTRRYNSIFLTITTGALADIVSPSTFITLQNVFADVEVLRISPRVPLPLNVVKVLHFHKRYAPMNAFGGDTILNLDRVPTLAMKRLLFFAASGATSGVPFTGTGSNAVIDTIRVSSNRRDHFGSAVGGISRRVLQHDNKLDYDIETWPTGWYVYDTVLDRSILSALATGDLSVLQAILTYQAGLVSGMNVSVFENGVQKLRGTRGR